MTLERWRELLQAAPVITTEDAKMIGTFVPKLTTIAASVRAAYFSTN